MKQQTAVEWMIKEIESLITIETFEKWKAIKEQAKAMDKQQMLSAQLDMFHFLNNLKFGMMYLEKREQAEFFAAQYYTETYEK
jgi:predicted transcriptional regulator